MGAHGLHEFNSSDTGALNEVRMVGGVPAADRYVHKGYRLGQAWWGKGTKPNSYEKQQIWNHTGS